MNRGSLGSQSSYFVGWTSGVSTVYGSLANSESFASARLASLEKSVSGPPYQNGPPEPARQAYYHWASVGRLNARPVFWESQRQNPTASSHETRTTGCSGLFIG